MKEIQEEIKKLTEYTMQILTTKELNSLGINDYYIKKIRGIGILEKESRGKYKVLIKKEKNETEEQEKATNAFQNFKTFIINRKYEEAYNALIENVHHKINHDYDNHIKTYFLLLQIILGDTYDFGIMEELLESPEEKNGSYVDEFILFRENVMTKNYYEAKKHLNRFKIIEKERRGHNNLSSKLFSILINEAITKLEQEKKIEIKAEKPSIREAYKAYQLFLLFYKEGDYEIALEYIPRCCSNNQNSKMIANNKRLLKLLTGLIKMRKEKIGFEQKEIDYSKCKTSSEILNRAIDLEDFQTAFKNIGKVTYQNNSQILDLFKDMLYKMYDLNKEYQKKTIPQEKNTLNRTETKEITYNEIYNYVYIKQYEELSVILTSKAELSRLESCTLKMLKLFFKVKENKEKQQEYTYQNTEADSLKRMYEAIKYEDIEEIKNTIARNKTFIEDTKEIDIYEMIIEDIIKEKEIKQTENEMQRNCRAIMKKMMNIVQNKTDLESKEIEELYRLIEERIKIHPDEILYVYWEILNTITEAKNSNIDASYFDTFENTSEDIDAKLLYLLRNGDYLSALNILKTIDFNSILKEIQFEDKLLLKRLLYIFKNVTNKTIGIKKEFANYPVMEDSFMSSLKDSISPLEGLKTKIKKRDFYGAFNYAIQANLEDRFLKDILAELSILYAENMETEARIYKEYLESIKNNDRNQVRISLADYEDLLKSTSIGQNLLYQNRLDEMKRARKNKNF